MQVRWPQVGSLKNTIKSTTATYLENIIEAYLPSPYSSPSYCFSVFQKHFYTMLQVPTAAEEWAAAIIAIF